VDAPAAPDHSIRHATLRDTPDFAHYDVVKFTRIVGLLGVALVSKSDRARAQNMTGFPAVDSAAVARAAYGRAAKAMTAHDVTTARREVAHAAESWPVQPSYVWAQAVLAAQAGDTAATLHALQAYAGLGLGRDLRAEAALSPFITLPAFAGVVAAHAARFAPIANSREAARIADSTYWPEGVDYDPRTRRYYVASIRHRTIAEISPDGSTRELWPRDGAVVGAMFGVRFDAARGALWATTSAVPQMANYGPADSSIAALLRIRISDGAIERRWNIPRAPEGHTLGDLAIGPHGDVFVTDSNEPVLYWLRAGADTLEAIRSPLFRSLQGIAPSPDGRLLYVADYSHGIMRVTLATKSVVRVADAAGSTSLGCDGLAWDRGAIVAVQNGIAPARIVRFALNSSGDRFTEAKVLDQNWEIADEPTIGTIVDKSFVYVANSQWEKYDSAVRRVSAKPLTRPRLLAVPLPR
jgi:sugar lactone lactonase YvrE